MKIKSLIAIAGLTLLTACGSKTVYVVSTDAPDTTAKRTTTTDAPIATAPKTLPPVVFTEEDEFIYDIESNYSGVIYVSDAQMIETGRLVCDALLSGMSGQEAVWAIESASAGGDDFVTIVALSAVANFCPSQVYKFEGL